jgi:AraC-like DNA-binding protein
MTSDFYIPQTNYPKNIIHSIWQVNGLTSFQNERIAPKGVVEIIFNLTENPPLDATIGCQPFQLAKCFINGYNTCPIRLQLPKHHVFFGVQFHPVAVKRLFKIPACEFANIAIDLTLLCPSFNSLWHQLAAKQLFSEKVEIIEEWIAGKIIELHPQEQLLSAFLENNIVIISSVTELAKKLCYSPRHLSRKIYELTKMNTEEFLLYKKYLHSLHLIHNTNFNLTKIAYHSNFADQSHFIKSFKSLAQITPGEYKQCKSHLPGHLFENVR